MKSRIMRFPVEILICVLLLSGCVTSIVLDSNESNLPVVVNCILAADQNGEPKTQTLTMCYVKGKSALTYTPIENAVVYIQHSPCDSPEINSKTEFSYIGDGRWESVEPMNVVRNNRYYLHVDIPGRGPISANTVCPDCHFTAYTGFSTGDDETGQLGLYKIPESDARMDSTSLWIVAQEYTHDGWKNLDYMVSTHPKVDYFNVTSKKFSDLTMDGSPNDVQDIRLQELFAMYQEIFPDLPVHEGIIRIGDMDYHDSFFLFAGPMMYPHVEDRSSSPVPGIDPNKLTWDFFFRFQLNWVNGDLDKYFRSVYTYDYRRSHFLTAIYSSPDVYSNIEGGVGIFGVQFTEYHGFVEPGNLN